MALPLTHSSVGSVVQLDSSGGSPDLPQSSNRSVSLVDSSSVGQLDNFDGYVGRSLRSRSRLTDSYGGSIS